MNITNYGDAGPRMLQRGDPGSSQLREGDFIADRELALTKDDRVVEERDKDALFLLVGKGQVITREVAAKHGLRCEGGRCVWGPVKASVVETEAEAEPEVTPETDLSDGETLVEAKTEPVAEEKPEPKPASRPAPHRRR